MTTQAPWFLGERALAYVSLVLTKRNEVVLRTNGGSNTPTNLLVEILQDGKETMRFFGVRMDAVLDLPTNPKAVEGLFSHSENRPFDAGIPFAECRIGVRKPEGIYRWLVEPVIEEGRALLRYHEAGNWQTLDDEVAAEMIDRVNAWYDVLNGGSSSKPRGRKTKTR